MASEHESSSLLSSQQLQALRSHNPVKQFLEIARNHPVLSDRVRKVAPDCGLPHVMSHMHHSAILQPATWWSVAGTG